MKFKKGEIVYFKIPDHDNIAFAEWFVYAVKHRMLARVIDVTSEKLCHCEFIDPSMEFLDLRLFAGTAVNTPYYTMVRLSCYVEV